MESLSELLEKIPGLNKFRQRLAQWKAVRIWPEVVGESIARLSDPRTVVDGILFVGTPSSAWANELDFQKQEILARLNRALGEGIIRDIRFQSTLWKKEPLRKPEEKAPTAEERHAASSVSREIENSRIRSAFRKLFLKQSQHPSRGTKRNLPGEPG